MQEVSATGVVHCDFAPEILDGLEGMRGSLVTSRYNMQDPEERNMVDSIEAMLMRDEQDVARFSECWGGSCFVDFCNPLN